MPFGKWISPINFDFFEEQVKIRNLEYDTKKLTTEAYLKLMLLAQLNQWDSLHEMSDALVDEGLQETVGFQSISVSQLSRRNREIPSDVIAMIFFQLISKIKVFHQKNQPSMPLHIIDSTTIPLNLRKYAWADFRKTKACIKAHLRFVMMDDSYFFRGPFD